jgi:hypothetical protein
MAVNVRFTSEVASNVTTTGTDPPDKRDLPLSEFNKWHVDITATHKDLFKAPLGVPPASRHNFRIVTDPLAKTPHRQPYRQSLAEREAYEMEIRELVENGWGTESCSRFAAPIISVKKGDGKLHMCVDYKGLNAITSRDRYPMPYIDDLLNKLHGSRYFTKMDLSSEYHQLRIHPDDRNKIAFISPDSLYNWRVLPFGLANAPAVFMHTMNRVLDQHRKYTLVYLDDIMVYSQN